MKKILKQTALVLALFVSLAMSALATGAEQPIKVLLDGQNLAFDSEPIIDNGRTLVPVRAIFDALGAEVLWNPETKTVTAEREETKVTMTIGASSFYVNDREIELDVPAKIVKNRTLVPVRAISESFDVDVDWIPETRAVILVADEFVKSYNDVAESVSEFVAEGEMKFSLEGITGDAFMKLGFNTKDSLMFMQLDMSVMWVNMQTITASSKDKIISCVDGDISVSENTGDDNFADIMLTDSLLYESEDSDYRLYQVIDTETGLPSGSTAYINKDTFKLEKICVPSETFSTQEMQFEDVILTVTYDSGETAKVWADLNRQLAEQNTVAV